MVPISFFLSFCDGEMVPIYERFTWKLDIISCDCLNEVCSYLFFNGVRINEEFLSYKNCAIRGIV